MTPLAHLIARTIIETKKGDNDIMVRRLRGCHFFECTGAKDTSVDLVNQYLAVGKVPERYVFLPFPKVWLEVEVNDENVKRLALVLEGETENSFMLSVIHLHDDGEIHFTISDPIEKVFEFDPEDFEPDTDLHYSLGISAILSLINHPKVAPCRFPHQAHRGLQKRIKRAGISISDSDWTEIKIGLSIRKPGSQRVNSVATGKRVYHPVRAHTRLKNDDIEFVNAHWRGDPTLGTRQSRYVLKP